MTADNLEVKEKFYDVDKILAFLDLNLGVDADMWLQYAKDKATVFNPNFRNVIMNNAELEEIINALKQRISYLEEKLSDTQMQLSLLESNVINLSYKG